MKPLSGAQIAAATAASKATAREYIENVTMRAVNQCIGRAIRHRNDYAAILLVDRRYEGDRIRGKLPGWITGSVVSSTRGADVEGVLGRFFKGKNSVQ